MSGNWFGLVASESGSACSVLDPPFGLFSFVLVRKHGGQCLVNVRKGLRICANVFFLLTDHKLEEILFSSGTDLVKTGLKVLVWSEVWLGPILQTNWAGSLAGVFSQNSDGFLCLGVPCLNVRDLVAQIVDVWGLAVTAGFRLLGWLVLVPAVAFGRVEAGWDDGISSSESERFFCGDLIGEIGGGLSLISASMTSIEFLKELFRSARPVSET